MIFGWSRRPNGDVWSGEGKDTKPILYRVGDGFMVAGVRTAQELQAIATMTFVAQLPPLPLGWRVALVFGADGAPVGATATQPDSPPREWEPGQNKWTEVG